MSARRPASEAEPAEITFGECRRGHVQMVVRREGSDTGYSLTGCGCGRGFAVTRAIKADVRMLRGAVYGLDSCRPAQAKHGARKTGAKR